ncbi:hypothetical protein AB0D89_38270 [Streptomyces luteogriseus]|uniref:hypothetical protein n=1 Tax=Streptomyces luteogriseus TaxID=68233 RepID=UPI0034115D7F
MSNALLWVSSLLAGAIASAVIGIFLGSALEYLAARTIGAVWRGGEYNVRGRWKSTYSYRSRGNAHVGEQIMQFHQVGRSIYAKNIGGTSPHRHFIKLKIDGSYLTGTWRNVARNANHYGVLQLRITADGTEMIGKWIGFDSNSSIQANSWKLIRQ